MTILWIDDDVNNLDIQIDALRKHGYGVEPFSDVDRAWRRIIEANGAPLCVIMDVMMGTGDLLLNRPTNGGLRTGEQFLRLLKEKQMLASLKVFVFTITSNPSTHELCTELGINFHRKTDYPGKRIVELAIQEFGEP